MNIFTLQAAGSAQLCLFVFENELLKGDHEFKLSIKYILNDPLNSTQILPKLIQNQTRVQTQTKFLNETRT